MNPAGRAFSVPGNLLLMGEYAVLEEGGLGLALAVERRARVALLPAQSLSITGVWPGGGVLWTTESPEASPLLRAAAAVVGERLGRGGDPATLGRTAITIDSSEFFDSQGRKAGFGSSAAAAVAAVIALLAAAGIRVDGYEAQRLAIAAHRRAQGGVGSGYDVTASLRGGMGVFHGGESPSWEPAALRWSPLLFTFAGSRAVVTTGSVRRYTEWKARNPAQARDFLADSNSAVRSFLSAGSAREAAPWFDRARRLGIELGKAIGVSASVDVPAGVDPSWCKALGAGNEMGVCLVPEGQPAIGGKLQLIIEAREGLRWEG